MEDRKWEVDDETLITLNDMSKTKEKYKMEGQH